MIMTDVSKKDIYRIRSSDLFLQMKYEYHESRQNKFKIIVFSTKLDDEKIA